MRLPIIKLRYFFFKLFFYRNFEFEKIGKKSRELFHFRRIILFYLSSCKIFHIEIFFLLYQNLKNGKKFFKKISYISFVLIISKIFKLLSYNIEIQFRIRKMFREFEIFKNYKRFCISYFHSNYSNYLPVRHAT